MSSTIPLLRIGAFSRASSLSVKALRAYHEAGLLVPGLIWPPTQITYSSRATAEQARAG